jgi:hypothetical protein
LRLASVNISPLSKNESVEKPYKFCFDWTW